MALTNDQMRALRCQLIDAIAPTKHCTKLQGFGG
jgi:hypothetical protein